MGIKYGFCNDVKSRRINLGRTTLICGTNAHIYSTDLTGTVTKSGIGSVPLSQVTTGLCLLNSQGECGGELGSFYTQTVSYNVSVQNNPMMIGCCADHVTDEGKLINSAVGGVTTSVEHGLSINGQGEPWAVSYTAIIAAINAAIPALLPLVVPEAPSGFYVPNSIDANLSIDSWQQGTGNWTLFQGKGTEMVRQGGLLVSTEFEYSVSVNTNNGRVDGSQSVMAYYTAGPTIPCSPVDVSDAVCTFASELNSALA